jgi:hypothetical protein
MPLTVLDQSPGDTEAGRSRAFKQAQRLTGSAGGSGAFQESRSRGLGVRTNVRLNEGAKDARTLRRERGLRTGASGGSTSDAAKALLSNSDFAKDFAREAKQINTTKGLTRSQRKAQTGALKTRIAVESGQLTGDAAEQALDLSRTSTERGLTSSQRSGLTDASTELLKGAAGANKADDASEFEQSLLKFFDI